MRFFKFVKNFIFFEKKKPDIKGFTLIELLVVIAIIGVLATLAVNSFASYRRVALLKLAGDNLQSLILGQREKAIYLADGCYGVRFVDGNSSPAGVRGGEVSLQILDKVPFEPKWTVSEDSEKVISRGGRCAGSSDLSEDLDFGDGIVVSVTEPIGLENLFFLPPEGKVFCVDLDSCPENVEFVLKRSGVVGEELRLNFDLNSLKFFQKN